MTSLDNSLLKVGARLRYPLHDANGVLLLNAGAVITERLLDLLHRRRIHLQLQACLKINRGGPTDVEIPIPDDPLTIGRRADCGVRPNSAVISGRHCLITKGPFGVLVMDLGSRNGTYVNDRRITVQTELSDQDRIRVGDVAFTIHMFAAVTANTAEGHTALREWVVSGGRQPPPGPEGRTEMAIDLDAFQSQV